MYQKWRLESNLAASKAIMFTGIFGPLLWEKLISGEREPTKMVAIAGADPGINYEGRRECTRV